MTLSAEVSRNLDDWLLTQYQMRDRLLADQFRAVHAKAIAQGQGGSGALALNLAKLAADELTVRAKITFNRFLQAAQDSGVAIDEHFRPYGRSEIDRRVRFTLVPELRSRVTGISALRGFGRWLESALSAIDVAGDTAARQYHSELDSIIIRNRTRAGLPADEPRHTISVHGGNVGIIQIGSHNSARAVQTVDAATVTQLVDALEGLLPLIANQTLPVPQNEVAEIITASVLEFRKPLPNWTLTRSLLNGVAGSIQTVAAFATGVRNFEKFACFTGN